MLEDVLLALGLLALVFVPAVCFIAIFRLIDYIADDELIARVQNGDIETKGPTGQRSPNSANQTESNPRERSDLSATERPEATSVDGSQSASVDESRPSDEVEGHGIRCRTCGTENWTGATFCQNCLQRVS